MKVSLGCIMVVVDGRSDASCTKKKPRKHPSGGKNNNNNSNNNNIFIKTDIAANSQLTQRDT